MKKVHYISGLFIASFVAMHLFNHLMSCWGADSHIAWMQAFRRIYRNPIVESMLLSAVLLQIITGLKQAIQRRRQVLHGFERLQIWSGLYLAVFFAIHLSAVLGGRFWLQLDTQFYFGVAGLNTFPFNLFFGPYYVLAMLAFFGHIAAIHHQKMQHKFMGLSPTAKSLLILMTGACLTVLILYGLTGQFQGVKIPEEYRILVGG